MRARRTDSNHTEIGRALVRLFGADQVLDVSAAGVAGLGDYLVGHRGHTIEIEVKTAKGRETPAQKTRAATWQGCRVIVRSVDDVIALYHALRRN